MATKEQVMKLIWHYDNLYHDTGLLVEFCGQRGVNLMDGFRDVCEQIEILTKQLKEMESN